MVRSPITRQIELCGRPACCYLSTFVLLNSLLISLAYHNKIPTHPECPKAAASHSPSVSNLSAQLSFPSLFFDLRSTAIAERDEKGKSMDGSIVRDSADKSSSNHNLQQQPDRNHGGAAVVPTSYQNVVVMRHGDRMDNFDPMWEKTAERPWDPPLVDEGLVRAFSAGRKFRTDLGFPIHRVFVSPFLRCVQTASEVVSALCAVNGGEDVTSSAGGIDIDPSKLKVAIEYGLCEMMNLEAIRFDVAPKDGNFAFNKSELEALLPAGTVDHTVKPVYEELPEWEESATGSRTRLEQIFKALADMYPSENLLLITHGEAVGVSVSAFLKDVTVYEVDYCGYSLLRRPIFQKEQSFSAGNFEQLTLPGQTGIGFCPTDSLVNGVVGDVA